VFDLIINKIMNFFLKFLGLPRFLKQIIVITFDILFCASAVVLAYVISLGHLPNNNLILATPIFVSIVTVVPLLMYFGIYKAIFRYSAWGTLSVILRAIVIYTFFYLFVVTLIGLNGIPRNIGIIQPILLFLLIATSRFIVFYVFNDEKQSEEKLNFLPNALVYGAGKQGRKLNNILKLSNLVRVVGYLEDDEVFHDRSIDGISVFSPNNIEQIIYSKKVSYLILAVSSSNRKKRGEIIDKFKKFNLKILTIPSIDDLVDGKVTVSNIKELDIEDILGRETVQTQDILMNKKINSRVVMVTGAGGSIGSELCRQIVMLNPKKILLLEINEFNLYNIHNEILELIKHSSDLNSNDVIPLLACVQNKQRMENILSTWNVDTIYHAAAYKHVPLVEHNVVEGIKNNVFGTVNICLCAIKYNVKDFVLISTDKAVRPTNIMGASKRLSELVLQGIFSFQQKTKTIFSMVRFGNVINSSGSVIPKFHQQIMEGGPVTVTHKEVTRYFMTIPEAAQLVIQASSMAEGGEVFVLDMGDPVKIYPLAKNIIQLSGFTVRDEENSEGDIEIQITGLRPGEKLFEELQLGHNPLPTSHPKIQKAQDQFIKWEILEADLNKLKIYLDNNELSNILDFLENKVDGYLPNKVVVDNIYVEHNLKV